MKKSIIALLLPLTILSACKKEPEVVSQVVTVSYPTINLIGSEYIHIPVGGSYADEGATLIDDITGANSHITATVNEVDASIPGIYAMRYIAANANGFKTEKVRTILVLDYVPAPGITLDLSGPWQRTNGIDVNIVRMDTGLYIIDNFAGSTAIFPAYMITPTDSTIDVPAQTAFGLDLDCTNETLNISPPDTSFSYVVIASGFGTATRTFIKQ
jgi:hypothetical protein